MQGWKDVNRPQDLSYILPKVDVSVVSSSVLRCAGCPDVCRPFDLCGYVVVWISLQWVFRHLLFRGCSGVSAPTFILVQMLFSLNWTRTGVRWKLFCVQ